MSNVKYMIHSLKRFWMPSAEKDPGFKREIFSLNRLALSIIGILGILGPVIFMLIQIINNKKLSWEYSSNAIGTTMVIWDKLLKASIPLSLTCRI